jgi:hypothetical protein
MRGIFFTVIYFSVCVCFLYLIEFMSTTDLTSIVPPSEDIEMDGTEEQSVDHKKEEQKQYQFDVIVIGSGPGGG